MCGRVVQASPPNLLALKIVDGLDGRDNRVPTDRFGNVPARYNGAPSQELWVIRRRPDTGERTLDLLRLGLIPSWWQGEARAASDQRQGRDGRKAANVPGGIRAPTLHSAD
jgi:putative SOS response-associated peptidase YedK